MFQKNNKKPFVNNRGPNFCDVCGNEKTVRLCKCHKVKLDKNGNKYKKYSGFSKVVTCCLKCAKNK